MKLLMCYLALALSIVVPNQVIGMHRFQCKNMISSKEKPRLSKSNHSIPDHEAFRSERSINPTEEVVDRNTINKIRATYEAVEVEKQNKEIAVRAAELKKKEEDERLAAEKEEAERNTPKKVMPLESWVFFEEASTFQNNNALQELTFKIRNHRPSKDPDERHAQNQQLGKECIEIARTILVDKYAEMHPYERIWTLSIVSAANDYLTPLSKDNKTYLDLNPMDERTNLELQVVRECRPRLSMLFKMSYSDYKSKKLSAIYEPPNASPANIELGELLERFNILRNFAGLKAKNCPKRWSETEDIVLEHLWKRHLPQEEDQAQELINALRGMFRGSIVPEWGGDYATALLKHLYNHPSFTQEQLQKSLEDPDFLRDIFEPYAKKDLKKIVDMYTVKSLKEEVYASLKNYCQNPRAENTMECLMTQIQNDNIYQLIHIEVLLHPDEGKKLIEIISKGTDSPFIVNWPNYVRKRSVFKQDDAFFGYGSWLYKKYPVEFQIFYGRYLARKMEQDFALYEQHIELANLLRSLPLNPNDITDDEIKNFYDVVIKTTSKAHTRQEYAMELETLLVVVGAYKQAPELLLKYMDENMQFQNELVDLSKEISGYESAEIDKNGRKFLSLTTSPDILIDFCRTIVKLHQDIWMMKLHDSEKENKIKEWAFQVKPRLPF
ncbi:hypothetical protein CROQUDRAFT_719455 [Cronartium quercuum f. sp. fusiforme G11]|uniref:Uncharacterized protein n=1 Tax=Cronartium quercuum f. sp. fusiforme G11 TaxID=708437 RepID=A0A9P6THM0_9BASI|nr:hypothetical protein CROQUDRAFT_719455 [Cronartium quercuum f. sp. fusiforme G11]